MYDGIVVGGGIVGAAVAYHLVCDECRTLLVDRGDAGRATTAGAGIISPEMDGTESAAWYRIASVGKQYYGELVQRLAMDDVTETSFKRLGILLVDRERDDAPDFGEVRARVRRRVERGGSLDDLHETRSLEDIDGAPPLTNVRHALYYADAGRVRGMTFRRALIDAAMNRGLDVVSEDAIEITIEDGEATGIVTDEGRYAADAVVVAGGAWSSRFEAQLNVEIPVNAERGQILHVESTGVDPNSWPIVTTLAGRYFVPWSNGRLVIGATHESDVGADPRVTVGGVHSLAETTMRTIPALERAEVTDVRVGLRPVSRDRLPIVGAVPDVVDAYVATGHGSSGLLLGPYTGKLVADAIAGRDPSVDISVFDPARFVN